MSSHEPPPGHTFRLCRGALLLHWNGDQGEQNTADYINTLTAPHARRMCQWAAVDDLVCLALIVDNEAQRTGESVVDVCRRLSPEHNGLRIVSGPDL